MNRPARAGQLGEPPVLLDHVAPARLEHGLVVGPLGQQALERVLVRRLTVDRYHHFVERQQVHVDTGGHQVGAVSFHLARRAQVGDVGDAQLGQLAEPGVVELGQLTGAVQPPR